MLQQAWSHCLVPVAACLWDFPENRIIYLVPPEAFDLAEPHENLTNENKRKPFVAKKDSASQHLQGMPTQDHKEQNDLGLHDTKSEIEMDIALTNHRLRRKRSSS